MIRNNGSPLTENTFQFAEKIKKDEHSVTVIGFVGSPKNPSQLIINDPLVGQVYWSRGLFDSKWNIFGRSGVVVY